MRKALLLAVALLAALGPAFGSGQPAKETPKELVVWHQADTPLTLKALEMVIAEFEKKNPGLKIKYQLMDMQNMKQSMSTAVPSGLGPDIFGSSIGAYLWSVIDAGLLYDMTDAYAKNKWEQRVVPWSKPYTKYKGRYWSVPNEAELVDVFYYHKEIFQQKGFAVPTQWEDLIVLADKLKKDGAATAIAAPGAFTVFNAHWEAMTHGVGVSQELLDQTCFNKGSWDRPEFERGFGLLKDLNDRQLWGKDFNAVQYPEALSLFVTKKSPMYLNGTWVLNTLIQDKTLQFDFFVPPPLKGVKGRPSINCGSGWQISAKAKNTDMALKFLDLVISEWGEKTWLENTQWVPPTRVNTSTVKLSEYQQKVLAATTLPAVAYSMFNIMPEDVNKATWAKMQEMYLGKATPKQVVETKQKVWETAIKEGRVPDPR